MRDRVVMVCGSRKFTPSVSRAFVMARLDEIHALAPIGVLVHGGCSGVDSAADDWARARHVDRVTFWANFDGNGPAGGPIRNKRMMQWARPVTVYAFPGGTGTANAVGLAKHDGFEVVFITPPDSP